MDTTHEGRTQTLYQDVICRNRENSGMGGRKQRQNSKLFLPLTWRDCSSINNANICPLTTRETDWKFECEMHGEGQWKGDKTTFQKLINPNVDETMLELLTGKLGFKSQICHYIAVQLSLNFSYSPFLHL